MSTAQRQELGRFRDHVRQLSVRTFPENRDGFDTELAEVRLVDQRVRSNLDEYHTGSLGSSMAKNRFDDVKPNEGTLVRLKPISKKGDGTYVNANYIDGRATLGVPFVYIATQAPLPNTVLDFWRMIYENNVSFIVMLCAAKENGKSKSETYWPARGERYNLGLPSITTVSENVRAESVHRTLRLRAVHGDEREVFHMQHIAWPDQGVPESSAPLMEAMQAIGNSPRDAEAPILVHCSGGVGRTGVFIAMHIALAQFQLERTNISVSAIVKFLKMCRTGMVQRKDQYIFLYYAILREMERMVLSAEKGVNLLDVRARHSTGYGGTGTTRRPTASPRVMPLPFTGASDPVTFLRTLVKERVRDTSTAGGMVGHSTAEERARSQQQQSHHDVAADMAAMQDYLNQQRHAPSVSQQYSPVTNMSSPVPLSPARPPEMRRAPSSNMDWSLPRLGSPDVGSSPSLAVAAESSTGLRMNALPVFGGGGGSPSVGSDPRYHGYLLQYPQSHLEEELQRMQLANRMKRFSPSVSPGSRNLSLSGSPRNDSLPYREGGTPGL